MLLVKEGEGKEEGEERRDGKENGFGGRREREIESMLGRKGEEIIIKRQ